MSGQCNKTKIKWNEFRRAIIDQLNETKKPILIEKVYNIYNKFGKKKYSQELIKNLIKIATETGQLTEMSLDLPSEQPQKLFANRKPVTTATFLILSSDNIEICRQKANSILENIIKQNNKNEIVETNKEQEKSKENIKIHDNKATIAKYKSQNCISADMIRSNLFHCFLLKKYRESAFSPTSIFNDAPIDLLIKICPSFQIFLQIIQCPQLRFIPFKYFPSNFTTPARKEQIKKEIEKLLQQLVKLDLIRKTMKQYVCVKCIQIEFNENESIILNLLKDKHFLYFWRTIATMNLIEHIDLTFQETWRKNWIISKKIIRNTYIKAITQTCDVNKENFTTITGIEKAFCSKDLPEKQFKPDFAFLKENVNEELRELFNIKNYQLINFVENENIESTNDFQFLIPKQDFLQTILCQLSALASVTVNGVICSFIPPGNKILEIIQFFSEKYKIELNKLTLENKKDNVRRFRRKHLNFLEYYYDYEYGYILLLGKSVAQSLKLDINPDATNNDIILSDISRIYQIINLSNKVPQKLGELIEALKRFFYIGPRIYYESNHHKFLSEFDWKYSKDALIYLRLLNFIHFSKESEKIYRSKYYNKKPLFEERFFIDVIKLDDQWQKHRLTAPPTLVSELSDALFFKLILEDSTIPEMINETFDQDQIRLQLKFKKLAYHKLIIDNIKSNIEDTNTEDIDSIAETNESTAEDNKTTDQELTSNAEENKSEIESKIDDDKLNTEETQSENQENESKTQNIESDTSLNAQETEDNKQENQDNELDDEENKENESKTRSKVQETEYDKPENQDNEFNDEENKESESKTRSKVQKTEYDKPENQDNEFNDEENKENESKTRSKVQETEYDKPENQDNEFNDEENKESESKTRSKVQKTEDNKPENLDNELNDEENKENESKTRSKVKKTEDDKSHIGETKINAKSEFIAEKNESKSNDNAGILIETVRNIIAASDKFKKFDIQIPSIFAFAYILFSGDDGIDYETLKNYMKIINDDDIIICKSINFLMMLSYVYRISCRSAMPYFISFNNVSKKSARIGHIFSKTDGCVNRKLANDLILEVYDRIFKNNNIEFQDLLNLMPLVSPADLLLVLNVMICDETIIVKEYNSDVSLYESHDDPCQPIDDILFCYKIYQSQLNPSVYRPLRYYSVTRNQFLKMTFIPSS